MNQRVALLILANLGLAPVACTEKPPVTSEPMTPLEIPPMPSSAAVAPRPPPTHPPSAPAPAQAATDEDDDNVPLPLGSARPKPVATVRCRSNTDCGHLRCALEPGKKVGTCQPFITRGRPLVVEGKMHVAPYTLPVAPSVTGDEIDSLREAAREEHASIAAFARTIAELMALGAPLALLFETQQAMADEIRHTERTLDLLERFTGERPQLGPLPAATAPLARPATAFFRDVLHGGAIGETRAAEEAEHRRVATHDDGLRDFYEMIAVDEARHAALAIKTLRWLIDREPSLTKLLDARETTPFVTELVAGELS